MPEPIAGSVRAPAVIYGKRLGYFVLVDEWEKWVEDWDGKMHPTREDAEASAAHARASGYTTLIVEMLPIGPAVRPEEQQSTRQGSSASTTSGSVEEGHGE